MEKVSEILMTKIKELTEAEVSSIEIISAIYLRKIEEKLKQSMDEISESIDNQIKFYGQNKENYNDYKNKILDKYNQEFEKIIDEYQSQFVNIVEELSEAQANQKVCMANCKKLKNMQQDFLNSVEYVKYVKLKKKYKEDMDNSLTKVDFDRNYERYHNLKNPVTDYDKKIKASLEKAQSFEEVIAFGKSGLNQCIEDTLNELDNLVSQKTKQIATIQKVNIFSKLINKITNIFNGKKKLKTYIIDNSDLELTKLEQNVGNIIEQIRENTINFIEKALTIREESNSKFISAVNG